ncbi:hypothetical protein QBC43DRAFT_374773 [Cladorrhinum sp. PSN259]|nr:hypothetical protein QBC43DRAFT_374773 [Cladorrhinum sp. PSN259]
MDHHSLRSRASQETLVSTISQVSLLEIDPTPMDSPTYNPYDKDLPPVPEESLSDSTHSLRSNPTFSSTTTTTSLGLSGSGHGPIYYLMRIQRYSSYTFGLFASLHLATTSIIPLVARSVPSSESYLLLAREIYQTPLSEPLLVGLPIIAHVGSGIALRLLRRAHNLRRYGRVGQQSPNGKKNKSALGGGGWPSFSWIAASGYGLAAAVGAHVAMNRGLPLFVEGDSSNIGLAFVAHGFARHPVISWVSYAALLGLGCGHMVWGWAKFVGAAQGAGWQLERHTGNVVVDTQTRKQRRRRLLIINGVSAMAVVVWATGGLGIVARGGETLGWVGKLYDGLYAKVPGF